MTASVSGWPICECDELGRLEDDYFICANRHCRGYGQVLRAATADEKARACGYLGCGLPADHPVHIHTN